MVPSVATSRWSLIVLAAALSIWGLTDVRNRGRVDPNDPLNHKTDLTVYTEAGSAFFDGRNPYDVANPRGWKYLYPPLFAILMAPLARLDPQWQAVAWFFFSLLIGWGCYRECRRIWSLLGGGNHDEANSRATSARARIPWLAAATIALPAANCLQRGQIGILLAYLLLLGFRYVAENRNWWGAATGGMALALAIAFKLTPALPVGVLLLALLVAAIRGGWQSDSTRRFLGASGGVGFGLGLFFFSIPGLAIGQAENVAHLKTWIDRVVVHHDMGEENNSGFLSVRNQSLSNAITSLGNWTVHEFTGGPDNGPTENGASSHGAMPMDNPVVAKAIACARALLVALLLLAVWQVRSGSALGDMAAIFGLACVLSLIVSPLSWAHHFLIALPALIAVPLWHVRAGRPRMATWLAIAFCSLMTVHYLLLDWAGRLGLLGIGSTLWFVVPTISMIVGKSRSAELTRVKLRGDRSLDARQLA